jgi:hypothetical protein
MVLCSWENDRSCDIARKNWIFDSNPLQLNDLPNQLKRKLSFGSAMCTHTAQAEMSRGQV